MLTRLFLLTLAVVLPVGVSGCCHGKLPVQHVDLGSAEHQTLLLVNDTAEPITFLATDGSLSKSIAPNAELEIHFSVRRSAPLDALEPGWWSISSARAVDLTPEPATPFLQSSGNDSAVHVRLGAATDERTIRIRVCETWFRTSPPHVLHVTDSFVDELPINSCP